MAMPWTFVHKITNSKHQITNNSQITNSKAVQRAAQVFAPRERFFCLGFCILVIVICLFFRICYLEFQQVNEL